MIRKDRVYSCTYSSYIFSYFCVSFPSHFCFLQWQAMTIDPSSWALNWCVCVCVTIFFPLSSGRSRRSLVDLQKWTNKNHHHARDTTDQKVSVQGMEKFGTLLILGHTWTQSWSCRTNHVRPWYPCSRWQEHCLHPARKSWWICCRIILRFDPLFLVYHSFMSFFLFTYLPNFHVGKLHVSFWAPEYHFSRLYFEKPDPSGLKDLAIEFWKKKKSNSRFASFNQSFISLPLSLPPPLSFSSVATFKYTFPFTALFLFLL